MKFDLLAHSCLWLEHAGTSVLIDPWLRGSAYDGAWALVPDPADLIERLPRPDWILYSHGHPDHFHGPTLEALAARFGHGLRLLFPEHALPHLRDEAARLGFNEVKEIPLDRDFSLGPDLSVRVYAVRADDSVQVIRAGGRTMVNANDCHLGGALCKAIARRVGAPDFYLGQASVADAYPFALADLSEAEADEAAALPRRRFLEYAAALSARCWIPIGSFQRFAHVENAWMNQWLTNVSAVGGAAEGRFEALYPGDGWSDVDGFRRDPSNLESYERGLAAVRAGALPLAPRAAAPPAAEIRQAAAERFARMFRRVPAFLRRRIGRLGFYLEDTGMSLVVDWAAQALEWNEGPPETPHFSLGAAHFAHTCRARWGWGDFHVSGRFRIHRWRESAAVETFLPVSILCDFGYLGASTSELLSPRALRSLWVRRAEAVELALRFARGRRTNPGAFARL